MPSVRALALRRARRTITYLLFGCVLVGTGVVTGRWLRQRHGLHPVRIVYEAARATPLSTERRHEVPTEGAPSLGPPDALLTVVVFSDLECPYCRQLHHSLRRIVAERPRDIRLVWRDFPLPYHSNPPLAHLAGRAAHSRGLFWAFVDRAFSKGRLEPEDLETVGGELGISPETIRNSFTDVKLLDAVQDDVTLAMSLGVPGVPTMFLNGRAIIGPRSYDQLSTLVDEEFGGRARALVPPDTGATNGGR